RLAALAAKAKADRAPRHVDMTIAQRREAVGAVLACVLLVADADARYLEQADDRRQNFLAWQARPREVAFDRCANLGQRRRERDHSAVFRLVANRAPARMVPILLSALCVTAGGLDVAVRERADPDVLPRGRDHEGPDPPERRRVVDSIPARGEVLEVLPDAL